MAVRIKCKQKRTPRGRPYGNCFTVAVWEFADARNAPLRIGNVKYMSGAMWASPPTAGYSRGIFDIGRTPKGRPYRNVPVTIPVYNVERKQSRSFVQSKPVSWVARGYVPRRVKGRALVGCRGKALPESRGRASGGSRAEPLQGLRPCLLTNRNLCDIMQA